MTTKLDAAIALAARGFKIFPITPGKKAPPLIDKWPEKATNVTQEFAPWWHDQWPDANIGIHCDHMVVVDVDTKKGGKDSFTLMRQTKDFPATLTTNTPNGGFHVFYRLPEGHPGVPNSVEALGKGLDIRSTNGYVVAPGSAVGKGAYTIGNELPVADAPDWLVQQLGAFTKREKPTKLNVQDAAESVVERAFTWLQKQEPAIEGEGGDARTYAVAAGLRDLGVSQAQALELLLDDWNGRCSPPWSPDDLQIRVGNAYRYAQNEPGVQAAAPGDFPVAPDSGMIAPKTSTKAKRLSEVAEEQTRGPGYLIKGFLSRGSYAETYGDSGEGKTFTMLDAGYHVAAGTPWMGRKVHPGLVLYLAFEGRGGIGKRAKALRQHYGKADVPFYVVGANFNLREQAGRKELGAIMADLPEKPALIVIDTLAHALMGGDENSAQDVSAFNRAVESLIESTGACVLLIHHSGKNKAAGARGSSALRAALDTEIEVDGGRIVAKKQRDMEAGEPIGFALKTVLVGLDEDGDELTSCVVEPAVIPPEMEGGLKGNPKRGFDKLCEIRPTNEPVTYAEWKEACLEFLGNKNVAARFSDIKGVLLKKKFIVVDSDGMITRRMTE